MDTWSVIASLRGEFLTQVEGLTPAQWDAPSLCVGWRVRDVVAHLVLPERFSPFAGLPGLVRAGLRLHRVLHADAVRRGSVPISDLLSSFREAIGRRTVPPGRQPENVLVDLVIHLQDIRRPLGLPWSYGSELLDTVAGTIHRDKVLGAPKRVAGLRLSATDTGWSAGTGDEVTGSAEALILAMSGRPATLSFLSGPGVATLAARVPKPTEGRAGHGSDRLAP